VHRDYRFGTGRWTHECRSGQRGGCFYLFRTEITTTPVRMSIGARIRTTFGVDLAAGEKYLGLLPLAAPEVIVDEDGSEYLPRATT